MQLLKSQKKDIIIMDDNSDCVYSTYTDSYHAFQLTFSQLTDFTTTIVGSTIQRFD